MSGRITSSQRLRRILAIVPWVAERDGPTVDEICERFAITRHDLLADLDIVFMVGIPPYTPDTLIDVLVEDDRVWIRLGDYFRRPLRLSPAEGLALLAGGEAVRDAPGGDPEGSLARGLTKLATALGVRIGDDGGLDVSLGAAPAATLEALRDAAATRHQVEIDYYSFGRDDHASRVVDPYRVYSEAGNWYLHGYCHRAQDERVFRVDRIATIDALGSTFDSPAETRASGEYTAGSHDLRITLRLAPAARWVAEHHPVESTEPLDDGSLRVTMSISAMPWLARLLVRLGPHAVIEDVTGGTADDAAAVGGLAAATATTILARYRA